MRDQRVKDRLEFAVHDFRELVNGESDAMIGDAVLREIVGANLLATVAGSDHARGQKIKIIFENAYLEDAAKIRLCQICGEIGVDWVKTSTGYAPSGATMEDLRLMRKHSPAHVQVKAAGGVRDLDSLLAVRAIGVTRVGASRTAKILDECKRRMQSKAEMLGAERA